MIADAREFLRGLRAVGTALPGQRHRPQYVAREADALGITALFDRRIYGARRHRGLYQERIIQRVLGDPRYAATNLWSLATDR